MPIPRQRVIFQTLALTALATASIAYAAHHLTERISIAHDGSQAAFPEPVAGYSSAPTGSVTPAISANGRFIVFSSTANNLVEGDTNYHADVFLYDRQDKTTKRVSVTSSGDQTAGWGAALNPTDPLYLSNNQNKNPSVSEDGRYIVFASMAENLPGGGQWKDHIYLHDVESQETNLVSKSSVGYAASRTCSSPAISSDGQFVAFDSTDFYLVPNDTNSIYTNGGAWYEQQIGSDVFVRDIKAGTTERVSLNSSGEQLVGGYKGSRSPAISADGRYVAFETDATNLGPAELTHDFNFFNIFIRDRQTGTTELISANTQGVAANKPSTLYAISADGRYVVFSSSADNFLESVPTTWKNGIFVRDRENNTTEIVNISSEGEIANMASYNASISPKGRFVTFSSGADNLVPDDSNEQGDLFVHDRTTKKTECLTCNGTQTGGFDYWLAASITDSGMAIFSSSRQFDESDTNDAIDIFEKGLDVDVTTGKFNWNLILPTLLKATKLQDNN